MAASNLDIRILGTGLLTPLATGSWPNFAQLLSGVTLTDRKAQLPEDIAMFDLVRSLGAVSCVQHDPADPIVGLLVRAIEEAFQEAGVQPAASQPAMPLFLGLSKGAMHALNDAADLINGSDTYGQRGGMKKLRAKDAMLAIAQGPHGYVSNQLKERLKHLSQDHFQFPGNIEHWVAACSSGLVALANAEHWLRRQPAGTMAVVAAAESSLLPHFVQSYDRLGVLAKPTHAEYLGRPLTRAGNGHKGFMLSEQAAALCLVAQSPEQAAHNKYPRVLASRVATEPYDLIRPSETAEPLIEFLAPLLRSETTRDAILHPHATGTQQHDETEFTAMSRLNQLLQEQGQRVQGVYANKGALGHGLGASGLVSTVLASLCHRAKQLPPMKWLKDYEVHASEALELSKHQTSHRFNANTDHIVWSAGFGGHLAGVRLGD